MSQEEFHQEPRAAYCEDDDDDEEEVATPLANVAVKRADAVSVTKRASYERRRNDGSDSGYSSKTGTNTSSSLSHRDMADVKIDTSTMERQPQPYAYMQRPQSHRRSSSRSREVIVEPPTPRLRYYVHQQGECYVCDTYGEHVPENLRASRDAAVPPSPQASKKAQGQAAQREEAAPRTVRRDSSVRASRPVSVYTGVPQYNYQPTQVPHMMQYAPSQMSSTGWNPPLTPSMPYSPGYSYTPAVMTTYVANSSYFERAPPQEHRPARSERRASIYGDAIVRQSKPEMRPQEAQRSPSTRDYGRSDSDRTIRTEDRDRMPPPPRPTMTLARRPSIRKSATYNAPLDPYSHSRRQAIEDDEAYVNSMVVPSPSRERRVETAPPPSSYKRPAEISGSRPPNRKSVSYSTGAGTTKVSSSTLPPLSAALPRRSTTTATPTERRKVVDAETYQAQRGSLTSNELTAEALRDLKQRHPSSRSETSSHQSHKTKSSSSGGVKSKKSNSEIKMCINGVNVSIPASATERKISISTRKDGDVSISLGSQADRDDGEARNGPQRRIERAPSTTSRASRVSSKSIGSKERARERDRERERDLKQLENVRRRSGASRSRSRGEAVRRSYENDRDSPDAWDY